MKKFWNAVIKSIEVAPGVPSSLRVVIITCCPPIVYGVMIGWLIACWHKGDLVDIPLGVRIMFGGALATLLGAKTIQGFCE